MKLLALLRGQLLRVLVVGDSMAPALSHGDRVLVRRVPAATFQVGSIVLAEVNVWAETPELVIKRVARIHCGHAILVSDNPGAGRDSRHFGPVPLERIIGVVVQRRVTPG